MKRHRVGGGRDWKGSLSLSHECRSVVILTGTEKRRNDRGKVGARPPEDAALEGTLHVSPRHTGLGSSQAKRNPVLGEPVVVVNSGTLHVNTRAEPQTVISLILPVHL